MVLPDRARLAVQERRLRPLDSRDETRASAFLRSVAVTLLLLFLLEAFAFYTQNGQFYWLRMVAGVICAGLLVYGAYREVE